jgi:hypothetical protein
VLAEVQGDLGRVLQARALEDPALCVLKRTVEARAADGPRLANPYLFICPCRGLVNVDVVLFF